MNLIVMKIKRFLDELDSFPLLACPLLGRVPDKDGGGKEPILSQ